MKMKTITLKTDDEFFAKVTELAKRLHISKSELIREAIRSYEKELKRKKIKKILQKESLASRDMIKNEQSIWEETLEDGLIDD